MFKVVLDNDGVGRERFKYATLPEALAAIERLYHDCQENPAIVERVIGLIVNDQSDPDDEWVCPDCRKNWFSGDPELMFAPDGQPYCPECEESKMRRVDQT